MEEKEKLPNSRLTTLSHGSGCGCKIAPIELEKILRNVKTNSKDFNVLVGNQQGDDAAVIDIGNDLAIISTTDFFMPIVDNALDFGKISAANAISDIYAMGGKPISALAILGWPIEKLGTDSAGEVMKGAASICGQANIALAGGHSIENKEPFFGLSVNGIIQHKHIKTNQGAQPGDRLFITKPIGVGIIATALKRGIATEEEINKVILSMVILNRIGELLGSEPEIHAMTDVTGFGLIGHLLEMCEEGKIGAQISFDQIPIILPDSIQKYLSQFVMPDNTMRNFKAFHSKVSKLDAKQLQLLCDPQTSGGMLIAVSEKGVKPLLNHALSLGINLSEIGRFKVHQAESPLIVVND
ncbi:MAG: selenide, water dikinase SelD [Salibacteraceae bacterium]